MDDSDRFVPVEDNPGTEDTVQEATSKTLKFGVEAILCKRDNHKTLNAFTEYSNYWDSYSGCIHCYDMGIAIADQYVHYDAVRYATRCLSRVCQSNFSLDPPTNQSVPLPFNRKFTNFITEAEKTINTVSGNNSKRKRTWSRAVFSNLQRKGLEKRFQVQKYIMKPDRRQLAATLGLTDAQVKVWFQNRRMKWRNTKQEKDCESPLSANKSKLKQ